MKYFIIALSVVFIVESGLVKRRFIQDDDNNADNEEWNNRGDAKEKEDEMIRIKEDEYGPGSETKHLYSEKANSEKEGQRKENLEDLVLFPGEEKQRMTSYKPRKEPRPGTVDDKSDGFIFVESSKERTHIRDDELRTVQDGNGLGSDTLVFTSDDENDKIDNDTEPPMRTNFFGGCPTGFVRAVDRSCQQMEY